MKASTPTPLFDQAPVPILAARRPSPQPLSPGERGEPAAPRTPSPSGRRWPEGSDEGLANLDALDWPAIEADLDAYGCAIAPKLFSPETCRELAALYPEDTRFRSRIVMGSHGFGRGEYKYFANPLPDQIVALRRGFYPHLAPIADRWNEAMSVSVRYPADHDAFLARCHEAGQKRPTPLLLHYGPGDYNCLHQDVYGEHLFPLQVAILLSEPGRDFTGGEFLLTEQRPRMQSRAEVAPLTQGDGVIFAVRERPVQGTRGTYRVNLRHGVSRIKSGERFTLGVIFHDAA
ncbi:MAG TPA: 2OG-Fe(II) oxygenase [Roseiarcus sp.]|nr:2OG-Fe(II) oxygenase [Roseiarcus sp.]